MKRRALIVLACAATLAGCASPEATRQRGGGHGGDTGNRAGQVKMHEGSRQYWETPVMIYGRGPSLAPSEQARDLSLGRASQGSPNQSPQPPSSDGGRNH